jgi:hypothetical protein
MFRNITNSPACLPRYRYRTRASAHSVPSAVAMSVLTKATSSEFRIEAVRSGIANRCR